MLSRQDAKALRGMLRGTLDGGPIPGYESSIGNASFNPALGTITFKVTLTQTGKDAEKARAAGENADWDAYESYSPLKGRRGQSFKSRDGRAFTMTGHTRTGKIVARREDGREFTWKRDSVILLMGLKPAALDKAIVTMV